MSALCQDLDNFIHFVYHEKDRELIWMCSFWQNILQDINRMISLYLQVHPCFCARALKALWGYLKKYGINTTAIWENIKDIILKTVIRWDKDSQGNRYN